MPVLGLGKKKVDLGGMRLPVWALASIAATVTGRMRTPASASPARTAATVPWATTAARAS